MRLIFIYGLPAVGKLTVAQELATITGYKLFHNHLAVDLLLSVFEFGSVPFVELREQIWLSIFDQACRAQLSGLIFTFAPEDTVGLSFIQKAITTITKNKGEISFIELVCPAHELTKRIDTPSRRQFQKLTSIELFEQLNSAGIFDSSYMPKALLSLDTSVLTPFESATKIAETLDIGQP
jgi:hypothetical protein